MFRIFSSLVIFLFIMETSHACAPTDDPSTTAPIHSGPILILGDSLSAAYGIDEDSGWVALLRQRLQTQQISLDVVNASISGETTSGGLNRLPRLLEEVKPSVVVIELGGNDGLRGYPIPTMKKNLQKAIDLSRAQKAEVLLVGMLIPPNYGPRYGRLFSEAYPALAEKNKIAVVPFFLDGIATHTELMQNDGIHPTAEGQPLMLDNVWGELESLLPEALNCTDA